MYVYIHFYLYIYRYLYTYIYIYIYQWSRICMYIHVYIYKQKYIYIFYIYAYMYIYMYIYIHIYSYIYTNAEIAPNNMLSLKFWELRCVHIFNMHTHTYVICMYIRICIYMYVNICKYVYKCSCIHIIHTYIYSCPKLSPAPLPQHMCDARKKWREFVPIVFHRVCDSDMRAMCESCIEFVTGE